MNYILYHVLLYCEQFLPELTLPSKCHRNRLEDFRNYTNTHKSIDLEISEVVKISGLRPPTLNSLVFSLLLDTHFNPAKVY